MMKILNVSPKVPDHKHFTCDWTLKVHIIHFVDLNFSNILIELNHGLIVDTWFISKHIFNTIFQMTETPRGNSHISGSEIHPGMIGTIKNWVRSLEQLTLWS